MSFFYELNTRISNFIWGPIMLTAFLAIGLLFTLRSGFFQVRFFHYWIRSTLLQAFFHSSKKHTKHSKDIHSITPFQSLCTALAATVGTGNIAGVATAITIGGPGSIFWMWVSAFLGMMTSFAEKSLGIKYRYRSKDGHWVGGAMVYMERGLHAKWMGILFCFACTLASFGIGNMVQVNTIADSLSSSFQVSPYLTASALTIVVSLIILGGLKRIARITELLIPFMAAFYILGGLWVIGYHYEQLPKVFQTIFTEAFRFRSIGGGIIGYGAMNALRIGISRGVFSNEAGLGSSVMVHAASDTKDPVEQGMWGICEVFIDTIVLCTITALVILTSGVYQKGISLTGAPLTSAAFSTAIPFGDKFLSISIVLFALATVIGWSYFGEKAVLYLFGNKAILPYKIVYVGFVFLGCISSFEFVWSISDTFNGLMAIPNLTALFLLSNEVIQMLRCHMALYNPSKQ